MLQGPNALKLRDVVLRIRQGGAETSSEAQVRGNRSRGQRRPGRAPWLHSAERLAGAGAWLTMQTRDGCWPATVCEAGPVRACLQRARHRGASDKWGACSSPVQVEAALHALAEHAPEYAALRPYGRCGTPALWVDRAADANAVMAKLRQVAEGRHAARNSLGSALSGGGRLSTGAA